MAARLGLWDVGVGFPGEEGAEREVLDDRELGENFGVVHLDHALLKRLADWKLIEGVERHVWKGG